jgi:hypothetical protein
MPPDFLLGWLFSIEQAVLNAYSQHPQLHDKELETIYDKFKDFFRPPNPLRGSALRTGLRLPLQFRPVLAKKERAKRVFEVYNRAVALIYSSKKPKIKLKNACF